MIEPRSLAGAAAFLGAALSVLGAAPAFREPAATGLVVAVVAEAPVRGNVEANRELLAKAVAEAALAGARYVVLPELATTGELDGVQAPPAEPVPGPTTWFFGKLARRFGVWIALSLPESIPGGGYHVTSVLLDEHGHLVNRCRKVLARAGGEDGSVTRGDFREIVHTVDDEGVRVGIVSGDDVQVGVPRLANLGAELILVNAGREASADGAGDALFRSLSRDWAVNLAVARRGSGSRAAAVFTWKGEEAAAGGGTTVASLKRRELPWRIESALGLPASVPVPSHEPATPEIVALGRRLFFDRALSSTGTVACATCHRPEQAFTNGKPKGVGVHGRRTMRNVPSLLNVAFRPLLRWDGYASTLENFAKYPLSGYNEMDFHYLDRVEDYLLSQPDYVREFRSAMGVEEIRFDDVARALSTYQRTLVSGASPFDRYWYGGEREALSPGARRGLKLFTEKLGCENCHRIEERNALLLDFRYHFLGVGYDPKPGASPDIGLGAISTQDLSGFFQTPSLRNVAETAPYMHDGSFATLEEVVRFYEHGGNPARGRPREIAPFSISDNERQDLLAFLRSLTGDQNYDSEGRRLPPAGPRRKQT